MLAVTRRGACCWGSIIIPAMRVAAALALLRPFRTQLPQTVQARFERELLLASARNVRSRACEWRL